MLRDARIVILGCPHHLIQRGNNRQDVFFADDDRRIYLGLLAEESEKHVIKAIRAARDSGYAIGDVEKLLHAIIRKSVKVNKSRKLWGSVPYHVALCLHTVFNDYPERQLGYHGNRLKDPEPFMSQPASRGR